MIRKISYIFFLVLLPIIAHPQGKISKKEILANMGEIDKSRIKNTGYKLNFDSIVVKEIDYLKDEGIDTVGVYSEVYSGFETTDSCECGITPWVSYIQRIKNGKTFQKKITKCCRFEPINIKNSTIIRYYIKSKEIIDKERIIPLVTGLHRYENGKSAVIMVIVDHTTHYNIYCEFGGKQSFITFEQFDIENENNLFHFENNNTAINSWRKLIQNQINECETK